MDKVGRRLAEVIERDGWALQAVVADHYPWQVDFTYTVGNTAVGLPELLVVGMPPGIGGNLLNRLTELLRAGEITPRAGAEVPSRLAGFDTPYSLRFGAVADRWALQYGVMAYDLHLPAGDDPRDSSFLQVVLPDVNGRFWDEPGHDRLVMDRLQPGLSEPLLPWRSPFVPWVDLHGPPPGDAVVLVPVPGARTTRGRWRDDCGTICTAKVERTMATLDELVELLYGGDAEGTTRSTSLRLPERVHRAASVATELGMDESLTAATTHALLDRILGFVRQRALAEHLSNFPEDVPSLASVAARRVSGSDHAAVDHPGLVREVADWYERHHPEWATSGRVDEAVDRVLDHVEMLASGVGSDRSLA